MKALDRIRRTTESVQVRLGTAVAVMYVAAVSLVGIEVLAILLESTLLFAVPLAPVLVIVLGTIALQRRRAARRSAGRTVAPGHVAQGSRVRTGIPGRAPRNRAGSELVSRHP